MRYRDVEKRLRDLERHYHEDEAGEDVPDADVLSDDEVLQIALSGVRSSCLRFDGFAQCGLTPLLKPTSAEGAYWQRIGERASVLCAERNLVLIVLTSYEAQDAITALEQGLLKVYDFNTFPGCQSPRHFTTIKRLHIIPPWQHPERDRLWTLASVLHRAMCTWEDQVGEVPFTPNADSVLAWLHLVAEKIG